MPSVEGGWLCTLSEFSKQVAAITDGRQLSGNPDALPSKRWKSIKSFGWWTCIVALKNAQGPGVDGRLQLFRASEGKRTEGIKGCVRQTNGYIYTIKENTNLNH